MDFKRMFIAFALSFLILMGWEQMFPRPQVQTTGANATATSQVQAASALSETVPITVQTDTVQAIIDEKSGDLRAQSIQRRRRRKSKICFVCRWKILGAIAFARCQRQEFVGRCVV